MSEGNSTNKSKPKAFRGEWLRLPEFREWLIQSGSFEKCKVCNVTLKPGKSDLLKHASGAGHRGRIEALHKNAASAEMMNKFTALDKKTCDVEAAIMAFIVENDMPLSAVDKFVPFIKSLPNQDVLSKINISKQKGTNIVREGLRRHFSTLLIEDLNKHKFSIFIDETTDISCEKQLAIVTSFFKLDSFEYSFDVIDIVPCPDGSATAIYSKLISVMQENNINISNWIGFCSDTTNSMMGAYKSVAQLIRTNHPQVHIIKCVCHLIHLCSSHACKKLPNSLEDLCRTIFNHFSRSPKNTHSYKEFQKFYELKPHKFLRPCQTRWLSLQNCVRRILEQWTGLGAYWANLILEDPTHANQNVYSTLNNPYQKCLMHFVDYVLGLLNNFNTFFQSDGPQFFCLKDKVVELSKTIALNFMNIDYVKSSNGLDVNITPENFLPLNKIYLGIEAYDTINNIPHPSEESLKTVRESALSFYIETLKQIKKRFSFEDEIYGDTAFLIPKNAMENSPNSLVSIGRKYLGESVNINQLDIEWRALCLEKINESDTLKFWEIVNKIPGTSDKKKYNTLLQLVSYFFGLPFSNSVTERLFSTLGNIKTRTRNKLHNETLAGLICSKQGLKRTKLSSLDILSGKLPKLAFKAAHTAEESRNVRLSTDATQCY